MMKNLWKMEKKNIFTVEKEFSMKTQQFDYEKCWLLFAAILSKHL